MFFRVFCRKYPQIPPCVGTSTLGKSWSIFQKDESYSISKDSILCYGVRMIFVDGKCLECVGVEPDIVVPFDVRFAVGRDSKQKTRW